MDRDQRSHPRVRRAVRLPVAAETAITMSHPPSGHRVALWIVAPAILFGCSAGESRFFDDELGGGGAGAAVARGGHEPIDGPGGSSYACPSCASGGSASTGGAGGSTGGSGGEGAGEPGEPQVCYPGPARDYTVCRPLVEWSAAWGAEYTYPSSSDPRYLSPLRFVDLATAAADLPIAENFVLDEVMQQWKGRYGVYQVHTVESLQTLRDMVGGAIHVNSGYRSPAYNASIDGATYSRHMYGDAADIWSDAISLTGLADLCDQLGAGYIGMYDTFVHCDWRDDPLDPAFFGALDTRAMDAGTIDPAELERAGLDPRGLKRPAHEGELMRDRPTGRWTAPATGFDEGEPYRAWTALDGRGRVIDRAIGTSYEPPSEAARIRVEIGRQLVLEADVPPVR